MMNSDFLALAELLCSRLCHDMAGPVGAVATGAELLAEDGGPDDEMAEEALALLAGSAAAATARLRFLRLALGGVSGSLPAASVRDMAVQFLTAPGTGGGLVLDWRDGQSEPWDGRLAKLGMNLVLLARDCLPRGGTLTVRARQNGVLEVEAAGKGAVPGESTAALQAAGVNDLSPKGAQGYYTACAARQAGLTISVRSVADLVIFRAG